MNFSSTLSSKATIVFFLVLLGFYIQSNAQNSAKVIGTVQDAVSYEPIIGATVVAEGTSYGAMTDVDGNYTFEIPPGSYNIIASISGHKPLSRSIEVIEGQSVTINYLLNEEVIMDEIVIVGSRGSNRTAVDTPVPVDVIPLKDIVKTIPQNDMNQTLNFVVPSFQSNRQSSSDATEFVDPASLRGLGPDQVLVLINGKRRHKTSLVNTLGTMGNGAVGTDLNAIPVSAIERVEVLRDGASAQYGSDAIAGVINIILKSDTSKLEANAFYGITSQNDGQNVQYNASYGFPIGKKGHFNVAGDYTRRDATNRADGHDLIIFDQSAYDRYFAYFGDEEARLYDDGKLAEYNLTREDFDFRVGDAAIENLGFMFNTELEISKNAEFYSFGGVNIRNGKGAPFRRLPSDYESNVLSIYPLGYLPELHSTINDQNITLGLRGKLNNWNVDLSHTFGKNRFDFNTVKTLNASLGRSSPNRFYAGAHQFAQHSTNIDFSRFYKDALKGLNIALGGEFRQDNYAIEAGEEASYTNYGFVDVVQDGYVVTVDTLGKRGGAQGFPGYRPSNEVVAYRSNAAAYLDIQADFTEWWLLGGAVRFENYSDFGYTINGKLNTRVAWSRNFAFRGSISSGFRAPSLHQSFYNTVSTDLVDNKLVEVGIFSNDSRAATVLGIPRLKEETSQNVSLGFTGKIGNIFKFSIDGYQINVQNRVVLTGSFGVDAFGERDPLIGDVLNKIGINAAKFFTNAVNTETRGLDAVLTWDINSTAGRFTINFAGNYNETKVGDEINIPTILEPRRETYFGIQERTLLERSTPRVKSNLSLNYTIEWFTFFMRATYFGAVARHGGAFGDFQEFSPRTVLDASVTFRIVPQLAWTIGVNNFLDVYPEEQIYGNTYLGVFTYAPVQHGFNGMFGFTRVHFEF